MIFNPDSQLTSQHYLVTYHVGPNQHGIRLDQFLKLKYRRRSREQLKGAIDSGAVSLKRTQSPHLIAGKPKPSSHLVPGDEVLVLTERKPEPEVCFDYKILYQDDELFVINKPAQLPVHPAGRYFFNTLLVHLKTQGYKTPLDGDQEFYLVHRIDKETSGVLILAKTKEACTHLTRQFAARTPRKKYLAVVRGQCDEEFKVDLPIDRSKTSAISLKMAISEHRTPFTEALTEFKKVQSLGAYSLVECYPKTGRQHQIRVHLDAVGHPIVGDKLYGMSEFEALRFFDRRNLTPEAEARLILPRHALHASWVRFIHPKTQKELEFTAPLPSDLSDFISSQTHALSPSPGPGLQLNQKVGNLGKTLSAAL